MAVADKVKSIIVEQLGVDEEEVTADASFVDDLNAERPRIMIELIAHQRTELRALVAHHVGEGGSAQHAPQRRVEQNRELRTGAGRADGLIKLQRINDAVARKRINHEPLSGLAGARIRIVPA